MIRGLVNNIKDEKNDNFKIILTGGNANYFDSLIENVVLNDDLLILRG